jgi:hypothetical protein
MHTLLLLLLQESLARAKGCFRAFGILPHIYLCIKQQSLAVVDSATVGACMYVCGYCGLQVRAFSK